MGDMVRGGIQSGEKTNAHRRLRRKLDQVRGLASTGHQQACDALAQFREDGEECADIIERQALEWRRQHSFWTERRGYTSDPRYGLWHADRGRWNSRQQGLLLGMPALEAFDYLQQSWATLLETPPR